MDQPLLDYVCAVLNLYRSLPDTPDRPSRADRLTAESLYQRNVPLFNVEAALALACSRRACRAPGAPPLNPIHSLRYFLPVIEEIAALPPLSPSYVQYCRSKFRGKQRPALSKPSA
jgi:hypothetical protein